MKILVILIIIGVGSGIGIFAISNPEPAEQEIEPEEFAKYDETITIGIIHRDSEKMQKRYQPLADYLGTKLSNENSYSVE